MVPDFFSPGVCQFGNPLQKKNTKSWFQSQEQTLGEPWNILPVQGSKTVLQLYYLVQEFCLRNKVVKEIFTKNLTN